MGAYLSKKSNLTTIHGGIKSPTKETICIAPLFANASTTLLPKQEESKKRNILKKCQ